MRSPLAERLTDEVLKAAASKLLVFRPRSADGYGHDEQETTPKNLASMRLVLLDAIALEETPQERFCIACHHWWPAKLSDPRVEYCGDCHREFLKLKAAAATPSMRKIEGG